MEKSTWYEVGYENGKGAWIASSYEYHSYGEALYRANIFNAIPGEYTYKVRRK